MYSHGKSEEIVGKALKKYNIPRSRVVILTKCYFGVDDQGNFPSPLSTGRQNAGDYLNRVGLSRRHILEAVDASVERLGTYIDVLKIHRLDRETPREEIMRALNEVVESGKVRYIGASSVCSMLHAQQSEQASTNVFLSCRWPPGNSRPYKILPFAMAGTSLSPCRTTTIPLPVKRNVK